MENTKEEQNMAEEQMMTDAEMKKQMKKEHPDWSDEDIEKAIKKKKMEKEIAPEVVTEKAQTIQKFDIKVDTTEMAEMKAKLTELTELLKEKKVMQEQIKQDATKGIVKEEKVEALEKLNDVIFEKADNGKGFAIYKDYSKLGADTKLKRLVR